MGLVGDRELPSWRLTDLARGTGRGPPIRPCSAIGAALAGHHALQCHLFMPRGLHFIARTIHSGNPPRVVNPQVRPGK